MRDALQDDDCVLIVLDDDGEEYTHQAGGFTCAHPDARGKRLPLRGWCDTLDDGAYRSVGNVWFYQDTPAEGRTLQVDRMAALSNLVGHLGIVNGLELGLDALSMRTVEWGEAWVPVVSNRGRGFLVWTNSD